MLSIITAKGQNNEIGQAGGLPWKKLLPADRKWFRQTIEGHKIVVGSKTFEEIRQHFRGVSAMVFTRHPEKYIDDPMVRVVSDIAELADYQEADEEVFVIGGGKIYKLLLPFCHKLYITDVEGTFSDADVFFPAYDPEQFAVISSELFKADAVNKYTFRIKVLQRLRGMRKIS